MSGRSSFSIRRTLGLLVVLASTLALACVAIAVVLYEATTFRPRARQQLQRQASVLGEVLRPALDFDDPQGAERYLKIYRGGSNQLAIAALYDANGRLFAADSREGAGTIPPAPRAADVSFTTSALSLWQPIERDGHVAGVLYLVNDIPALSDRLPQYSIMAGGVVLALLVVGVVLLGGVSRNVLDPLAALVQTTGRITKDEDYGVRAPVVRSDELGQLAESFNQMIEVVGRRESSLREAEERMRRMASASFEGIVFSEGGRILEVNEQAAHMFGYEVSELPGQKMSEMLAPQSLAVAEAPWADPRSSAYEAWGLRKDRSTFLLEVRAQEITYQGRRARVSALRDMTDRKRAEEERTRLEQQLQQAQRMEAIGRLAGGIAHDFNNMLTVILGQAEISLAHVNPADPLFGRLKEIERAGQHSADLTTQLLAFARRQTVVPKVLDLNTTVSSMIKMLQRLIGEAIVLAWHPGERLGRVRIDPTQVDQILANLCVNARDAIGGAGRVTIETGDVAFDAEFCAHHPDHLPGRFTMLAVGDDGPGIGQDVIAHIFEPFFTTKGVGEGTGLGLATVFGIVKQNDGFLTVSSEPGQGTTFRIYLPRFAGDGAAAQDESDAESPRGSGETVLLVEDEPAILELVSDMLHGLGYQVVAANTPAEALRQFHAAAGRVDLLLTDVIMPEMNGRELAERLVAIRPDLKCLFVSGYTDSVIAHRGVLETDVRFLQKPFSVSALAQQVRQALGSA
jgi:PAS domain S-box-containing protein